MGFDYLVYFDSANWQGHPRREIQLTFTLDHRWKITSSAIMGYTTFTMPQMLSQHWYEGKQGADSSLMEVRHGLSQQGVWVPFWTPKPLKRTPQHTQIFLCGISKNLNLKLIIEFSHLLLIPMTLINDTMPYFDEFIHVYG